VPAMHRHLSIRLIGSLVLFAAAMVAPAAQNLTLPNAKDSLKFAIIGDSGTGDSAQFKVAEKLIAVRDKFPYEFVLMMGDNLYNGSAEKDFRKKFETPYKPLLDSGMKFYASLGNHDNPNERYYKMFNMSGERFYTFKPKANARFFALDSNYMDKPQLQWLEKELAASGSDWKICFFHHPLYSSGGTHGSDLQLREQLEPLFLKYGVDAVFAGHEHFYERIKPQKGIYYFISGGAGKVRKGDIKQTNMTAKSFDTGYHFMIVELAKDTLNFQVITDQGQTVDSGALPRFSDADKKKLASS
jgi:Calcineurin-like phosphoesterase